MIAKQEGALPHGVTVAALLSLPSPSFPSISKTSMELERSSGARRYLPPARQMYLGHVPPLLTVWICPRKGLSSRTENTRMAPSPLLLTYKVLPSGASSIPDPYCRVPAVAPSTM